MAIDRSGNLAAQLQAYLNSVSDGVDTNQVVNLLNNFLPSTERVGSSDVVTTGVYKKLGPNDIVTAKNEMVTVGLWTNNTGSLSTFHTASSQDTGNSGRYYLDVYQAATGSTTSEVQFSIAYGHISGGGSPSLQNNDSSVLSTKATYSQYRNILLNPDDDYFTFLSSSAAGTHDSDDIYVINVKRSRFKEKIDPGNWSLRLSGSNGWTTLIDNSGKKTSDVVGKAGRVFDIVSGSLNLGQVSASVYSTTASNGKGYGLFYPDQGLFVINPVAISSSVGGEVNPTTTYTSYEYNQRRLFTAISGGADFQARSAENVSSNHYFIRANNREFNFSNNPTFVTGSVGKFSHSTMENDPKVFITTIGLYNDSNELIAVGKTSQPIPKDFARETLIRIKVDF